MSTNNACANCGKCEESSGDLKACMACKLVKYCNRDCQIEHRPQHKKACKKRAAELYDAALFKEHTPEDCPICFLPLPSAAQEIFFSCCGKIICSGCVSMFESGAKRLCAYCRTPPAESNEEELKRLKNLMEKGNGDAFNQLGGYYAQGIRGMPQDRAKSNELWLKAGELGCAEAYFNLGIMYSNERGGAIDKKKAKHYYELAAMIGDIQARNNLGANEYQSGNHHRAFKHFIISARAGDKMSLDNVKQGYTEGHVTKEEYANTLREYQKSQDETKSNARDKALTARNQRMDD